MTSSVDREERLRAYVPELLLAWPPEAAWQELHGTLVSADISGFTALSERLAAKGREGAEELSALICDCFDGMIDDALDRGGDIIKFGGDALLVWFSGEGHARRAVSAAIEMRRTIRRERRTSDGRKVPLSISIGVNSGAHHFVQIVGEVPDLVVTGPGATATVRAESDANAGMILVTDSTASELPATWTGPAFESGRPLTRRVADPPTGPLAHRAVRPPSRFVPRDQEDAQRAGVPNEHRQVAVSFLAFGGADELVRSGRTDELARRLQQLTTTIAEQCRLNGTSLLATDIAPDGGKFVIAGGAPVAVGHHEDRLLRTVRAVVDTDPGLHLHAGVHRGPLFAGDLGSARRRIYTTLGDSMNLSARLSAKAGAGEIVVSRSTMEWSSVEFEVTPLPPFLVKGKGQPIHAGLLGRFVGRRAEQLPADGPLLGRRDELARLHTAVERAAGGSSQSVHVAGAPGSGKTRLLAEVLATAQGVTTVTVRCSPLDQLLGRSAAADLLRGTLGMSGDRTADEVLAELSKVAAERVEPVVPLLPLLAPLLGAAMADTEESALVPVELRGMRTAQLLVQLVTALADRPTLLVVDDLHHADETMATTVDLLAAGAVDVPLCVLTAADTSLTVDREVLTLEPLDQAAAAALVEGLVAEADVSQRTVREIVARSGGNPLFATEIVGAVLAGAGDVPDSLDAAVQVRLDRLEPTDRSVLRTAAVLGDEVEVALLARVLDEGVLADDDRWRRLDEFLVRVGPGLVRFRFDAHRRVAYESLPFRERRRLHAAILGLLQDAADDGGREHHATMARHAAAAGDDAATWRHATAAARAAAAAGLPGEAAALYRVAWASRRAAPPDELAEVAERAADTLEVAGDFGAAMETLGRALALSTAPIDRARLLRKRGDIHERRGDYAAAQHQYRAAERELERAGWTRALRERAQLDCSRSGMALRQSRLSEAWRYGNLALSQAERVGDWATAAHAALMVDNLINQMSWSGVDVARPDVRGLHEKAGDLLGAARWMSNRAVDHYYEGNWDEAVELYQESADQCARFGHLASEATALNNIGEIHSDRGLLADAERCFRTARRSWRAIGFGVGIALVQSNLGRLATRSGLSDDAPPLLQDAIERFGALGMASMRADAQLRLVEHSLLRGDAVDPAWWPTVDDLEDEVVLHVYLQRLRAIERRAAGDLAGADDAITASIERARAAQLPFDLVQALRVRAGMLGTPEHDAEIDAIHARLGIVAAPAVHPTF